MFDPVLPSKAEGEHEGAGSQIKDNAAADN